VILIVPILVFVTVLCVGGAIVLSVSRRRALASRLHPAGAVAIHPQAESAGFKVARSVGSLTQGSAKLKQQLIQAGFHAASASSVYLGIKLLLLLAGLVFAAAIILLLNLSMSMELCAATFLMALFFFAPNLFITRRRRSRREEIQRHLPGAVDLIEICVSSGLGLDMAWNMVSEEIRHVSSTLADEMSLTTLEMHLGSNRAASLRNMSQRTGAQELASLVALLVQSDRFGTNVAEALQTFAESMRNARSFRAEEAAEKLAVKLLIPLVLLIFPVMLIVMAGPACITLYKYMG